MSIKSECFALNIKTSETARRNICRGLALAENPFSLLITAVKCIADMSGDTAFLSVCEKAMESIYGAGLNDTEYKAHRISELEQSICKLNKSVGACRERDTRERLQFALRLQKQELEQLKKSV